MATVFPISSVTPAATSSTPTAKSPDEQFGQDTFLKLLVAQLKYQDPLKPTDSGEFLAQTAQFTQLETLQKIEKSLQESQNANQMLAASSMVGRRATYAITDGSGPTATSVVSVRGTLPKDAAVGARSTISTEVFTRSGAKIPLTLEFRRSTEGWVVQATSSGKPVGGELALNFDSSGDRSGNLNIPMTVLEGIPGTAGAWPANGISLAFGDKDDPTRLQLTSGAATVAVVEQNGNDGQKASGVVTGMHLTVDGPQLVIGGHEIPLSSITDVQA